MLKKISLIMGAVILMTVFSSCTEADNTYEAVAETGLTTLAETEAQIDKGEMHGFTAKELISQMKTGCFDGRIAYEFGNGGQHTTNAYPAAFYRRRKAVEFFLKNK